MFLSKNRRKSAKKVTKVDKQRDMDLSIKVCKQEIITNSRMIAGSDDAILNSDQRLSQNQNKSDSNPVKQSSYTEPISSNVFESSTSNNISDSNGEISCGEKLNRRTYSLEQVSKSLDQVMASGKALLDALASVNGTQFKNIEGNTLTTNASANSRTELTKRGTYDLDACVNNDSTLEASSNDISQDYSKVDLSNSSIKRSTYDLDAVSSKLDQSFEQNTCLEEMLLELSLDSTQNDSSAKLKRSTYDLKKVETALNESLNSDNNKQESLEQADNDCSLKFNQNRRGTYDLSDVSCQLDHNIDTSTLSENSDQNTTCEQAISVRRGTYNLIDVSDLLDDSVNSGKSIDESLGQISSMEVKRRTYDLSESNLDLAEQSIIENISDNNNTITAKNSHHDLSSSDDLSTDIVSKSEKRNTYILEDSDKLSGQVNVGNNSEKLSENGCHDHTKPVDGVLADLCLDEEDGQRETELTPGQWIEQMKGLKTPPPPSALSTPPTHSHLKLTLGSKKVDATKINVDVKSSKNISDVTPKKQRSQTISGVSSTSELSSLSGYEIRSRSMSDSKVLKAQLKSSSSPDFSTNTPSTNKVSHSESLEDISPGIRNYLANKLGLSEEQCIAVHRRMSSESAPDVSKLANHKTYSLDDVAHSLDIATSQGLPMTEVLDNLEATVNKNQNDTSLANMENAELKSDGNLTNLENKKPTSSVNNDTSNTKPQTLVSRKPYILANGSSFVESPTGKSPTIDNQFKLVRKKAVYKPSAKLQSFSHLLGGKGSQVPLRRTRGKTDPSKRNTYTLESVAESLEKAQDAGVPMLDALKRLSGSYQSVPSDLPDEKRKTYDLEDLSNTLETASTAGVPIVDTLRTIADPSGLTEPGTDEVFEIQKPQDLETPKPQPKRKPPPKPKRTFSNSSKPEIKFVSDSFVIEYYTSPPKRTQSDSSVQDGKSESQENYVKNQENYCDKAQEKYDNSTKENFYINQSTVHDTTDGKSMPPSNKSQSVKDKGSVQGNKVPSPKLKNIEGQKPTTKVVSDLDSLLLKLAAEVQKPTNVDTSNIGTNVEPSLNSPTTDVVSNTKPELSSTKADFPNTQPENLGTKTDFSDTKPENLSTKPDISNTNPDFSNTKPDDEGYCSLSRKPGTRSLELEHESGQLSWDDLFKKEKLLTAFENGVDITEESSKVEIIRSFDNNGRESQEGVIELTAEDDTKDQIADSESGDSPKADPVSRELNLLRLRLAEKQRDIEAQKQRTKEQQEEERKRFGQNVFWLAVGKGRERKEGSETNSTMKASHQTNFKQHLTTNQFGNASNLEPSNNNKFTTFTKQSSLDEDLPPSMGKLQDRTYNIKSNSLNNTNKLIPEEKGPLSNQYQTCSVEDRKATVQDRNPSEDIVQFRLSRQAPGAQDVSLNNEQSLGKIFPENSEFHTFEKAKTPVLNYKSRIDVPISENCPDTDNFQNSETTVDGYKPGNGNFYELDTNSKNEAKPPTSPQRKCWNSETAINSEPCIAVSESNYHVFDQNNGRMVRNSETQEKTGTLDNERNKDGRVVEARNCTQSGSDSPGQAEDGVYLEMEGVKKSPEEGDENLNLSPVEEDCDTPKKGLALFIGEENTVSNNDGLTPEQLRKREKFLRNRQQKIEEDKMKKEALLEKKRRKEEKMREIQLRREQEEQGRQVRLQEKREQAEHARQERQKYEMKRKEHLGQTNFSNGTLGGNSGYSRIAMNTQGMDRVPGGNIGYNRTGMDTQCVDGTAGGNGRYGRSTVKTPTSAGNAFEVHGPTQSTTPSAFSGFTGVQSYIKPSGKTNRKLIINAISYVCLPGAVNKDTKQKCLQAMTESGAQHFLILFKEGFKFRALYSLDLESNQVLKVYGIGPRSVTEKMIEQLYKYNSGGKEFSKIPAKGFSLSVDGFTLQKSCWQSNKPSVPSKTASNFKQSTYRAAR